MLNRKYGLWIVNGIEFDSKYQALLHATRNNIKDIKFWYHDDIFASVDVTQLSKTPLSLLYKERAQQLRDSYDYLILYYSGGADSHNILRTFLDNNIKIDEICVKWPKQLIDGKFYHINATDTTASNIWSEWNYGIMPVLKWIKQHHSNIKITIKDYVSDSNKSTIGYNYNCSNC
jgi:hypothetical protein